MKYVHTVFMYSSLNTYLLALHYRHFINYTCKIMHDWLLDPQKTEDE